MRGWMMFDLEFLTLHGGKSKTVVMAFENRAVHVGPLATYFPALNFVAYGYDLDEVRKKELGGKRSFLHSLILQTAGAVHPQFGGAAAATNGGGGQAARR
jgi:hypothetical protein